MPDNELTTTLRALVMAIDSERVAVQILTLLTADYQCGVLEILDSFFTVFHAPQDGTFVPA